MRELVLRMAGPKLVLRTAKVCVEDGWRHVFPDTFEEDRSWRRVFPNTLRDDDWS